AGRLSASVAIRTATLGGAPGGSGPRELVFPVGAGVVAESDPAGEWDETLAKAAALRALQSSHAVAARAP
ncbi:MAG TPA: chorismate-binding protein, partial [Phycisphaerales bacterium]|nr:chorismate-binding protein [Phycisphaerales bacterium]